MGIISSHLYDGLVRELSKLEVIFFIINIGYDIFRIIKKGSAKNYLLSKLYILL